MKRFFKSLFKSFKSVFIDLFKHYFAVCFCSLRTGILEILSLFLMFACSILFVESISDSVLIVFAFLIGKISAVDECVEFFGVCKKNKFK